MAENAPVDEAPKGEIVAELSFNIRMGVELSLDELAAEFLSTYNEGQAAGYDVDHAQLVAVKVDGSKATLVFVSKILAPEQSEADLRCSHQEHGRDAGRCVKRSGHDGKHLIASPSEEARLLEPAPSKHPSFMSDEELEREKHQHGIDHGEAAMDR